MDLTTFLGIAAVTPWLLVRGLSSRLSPFSGAFWTEDPSALQWAVWVAAGIGPGSAGRIKQLCNIFSILPS